VLYYFLIKNFNKFFIAAHRKSMDNITGGFAAGAAKATPIKQFNCFIGD